MDTKRRPNIYDIILDCLSNVIDFENKSKDHDIKRDLYTRLGYNYEKNEFDKSAIFKLLIQTYNKHKKNLDEQMTINITSSSHAGKSNIEETIRNLDYSKGFNNIIGLHLHWFFEDMGKNICVDLREYEFGKDNHLLVIDDNFNEILKQKYQNIIDLLRYKKFLELNENVLSRESNPISLGYIGNLNTIVDFKDRLNKKNVFCNCATNASGLYEIKDLNQFNLKCFRYIFVDLLMGDELIGLEIVKQLKELQDYNVNDLKYEIIVVSRSTNTEDIQKAFNFGASLYVSKERIFSIPYRIAQLGKESPQNSIEQNTFRNLNKLPQWKRKELQTTFIRFEKEYEEWVRKFPKSDIHCHLGGYLNAQITFELSKKTAYQTLINLINHRSLNNEISAEEIKYFDKEKNNIIIKDKHLNNEIQTFLEEIYYQAKHYREYSQKLNEISKCQNNNCAIDRELKKIISPEDFFNYLADKYKKKFYGLKPYHVTAIFNVILSSKKIGEESTPPQNILESMINSQFDTGYLSTLIQATHGHRINESIGGISLKSFLKGCDYTGSDVLQSKLTIKEAVHYICKQAKKDNIYYLSLRVTPLNFTKGGLSEDDVWDAICEGYQEFIEQNRDEYFLILTIIIAIKRHYNDENKMKTFDNIKFGIKYKFDSSRIIQYFENDNLSEEFKRRIPFVCGYDLTGLESGNDPKDFRKDFKQIFENCMPITIHAGEETESKSIWEAAYELHADRIGHGLSLADDKAQYLLERFKDFDISIELCPTSNFLTQEGFFVTEDKRYFVSNDKTLQRKYPSSLFLEKNLNFSICTDDPAVQNSDLSNEYLWLSEMTYREKDDKNNSNKEYIGINKWEALRIIRNGFKYCFLPSDVKAEFMKIIDHKVFKLLSDEY